MSFKWDKNVMQNSENTLKQTDKNKVMSSVQLQEKIVYSLLTSDYH